ncbi:MAG TPA: hypothetical protein VN958_06225 [Chitinophagaceae bacterium]|nr:hypothetical protein [Chitinophagaceae bacterium]
MKKGLLCILLMIGVFLPVSAQKKPSNDMKGHGYENSSSCNQIKKNQ